MGEELLQNYAFPCWYAQLCPTASPYAGIRLVLHHLRRGQTTGRTSVHGVVGRLQAPVVGLRLQRFVVLICTPGGHVLYGYLYH